VTSHPQPYSSLVALDELGRGTATLDGAAVAGAVLQRLASGVRCRGLFATHYHHLSDEHAHDPGVRGSGGKGRRGEGAKG
jgi:DNA mismatch repair ATPase MutS